MMMMLMMKTMAKKIHMKKRSITLATLFHSATLMQVERCSRKQLVMYSTLRISAAWSGDMNASSQQLGGGGELQNRQEQVVVDVKVDEGGFFSSGQQGVGGGTSFKRQVFDPLNPS